MQSQGADTIQGRELSLKLIIGILLLPGVFVWFLLRRGYSPQARALGFGWAGFLLLLSVARPLYLPGSPPSSVSAVEKPQQSNPVVEQAETTDPQAQRVAQRTELSPAAKQLKMLYTELEQFRRDPEFLRVGFGLCCRYNEWKRRVEELDQTRGPDIFQEHRISVRELLQLGFEYMHNEGQSTPLSESITARLDYALAPALPHAGGGRAMGEGWWCRDIETWFAERRALEQGDFARADNIRVEPACPHVLPNTTTGPELERRYYTYEDGKTRMGFVRVKLDSGPEVWAPLDAIEFR